MSAPPARPPRAIGLYLAVVQFFLALSWVVYVAYLPQLAQRAGIEPRWVPWLLMADQLVFLVCDLAVGLASDRAARVIGRIGRAVVAATLLSTGAFVLLPWAAPQGSPASSSR
jgi:MFS family permease